MLQGEHSAILSTYIKQSFDIKIFVLSIFKWLFLHRFYCSHKNIKPLKNDYYQCFPIKHMFLVGNRNVREFLNFTHQKHIFI